VLQSGQETFIGLAKAPIDRDSLVHKGLAFFDIDGMRTAGTHVHRACCAVLHVCMPSV
jgi:hypothetical protein